MPLALGLPLTQLSSLRTLSTPARIAIGWAGGTVILTVLLTGLSAVGIRVEPVVGGGDRRRTDRHRAAIEEPPEGDIASFRQVDRPSIVAALLCAVVAGAGLVPFAAGAATSADLSYFWGVKAVHFAVANGIDFQWMQQPQLIHLHPNYPPLWPVSLAWGSTVAGSLPWTVVPVLTWVYLIAAALIIHSLLCRPIGGARRDHRPCLWLAVLTGSTAASFSGGNAEGPLLIFVTVAITTLVVEEREKTPHFAGCRRGRSPVPC